MPLPPPATSAISSIGGFCAAAAAWLARAGRALQLDVAGANRDQLILAGVPEEQIHDRALCTAMHLDVLTSYRAEKEQAGRLAGVIRRAG